MRREYAPFRKRRAKFYMHAALISPWSSAPAIANEVERREWAPKFWADEADFFAHRQFSGAEMLILGVAQCAVEDFLGTRATTREAAESARAWIFDEDREWNEPFSFETACGLLRADPAAMRETVLRERMSRMSAQVAVGG